MKFSTSLIPSSLIFVESISDIRLILVYFLISDGTDDSFNNYFLNVTIIFCLSIFSIKPYFFKVDYVTYSCIVYMICFILLIIVFFI